MKTFIAGGTGFVGTNLARFLAGKGHSVIVMGQEGPRPTHLPEEVALVAADGTIPGEWQEDVSRSDLVINLAGASIFSRWTTPYKKLLRESRILTTRNIVEALSSGKGDATLFSTSAVGYYGFTGDEELDEHSPPGDDFLALLCRDWETEALRAASLGVRVIITRFGIVLGAHGGALGQMARLFRYFLGGPLGSGRQWFSWIHMDDLLGSLSFLLDLPGVEGAFNLTSPSPVRNAELGRVLGNVLHRPSFLPAPAPAVRLFLGEFGNVILKGQRVLPARLQASGYDFKYAELDAALASIFPRDSKP